MQPQQPDQLNHVNPTNSAPNGSQLPQQPERPYASPPTPPDYHRQGRKKTLIFWVIVVLIILVGLGSFLLFGRSASTNKKSVTTTQASTQKPVVKSLSDPTKTYSSTEFVGLSIKLPADWTTTETSGSGVLTSVSPVIQLQNSAGQTVAGAVILKIRNKQQPLPEFDQGNATAVLASDKIAYAQPSAVQRGTTYISFLQYASTQLPGLDGVYVTGDVGYQLGQAIPKADITPIDPVISLTFVKCDSHCTASSSALSIASTYWQTPGLSGPLKAILASLIVD